MTSINNNILSNIHDYNIDIDNRELYLHSYIDETDVTLDKTKVKNIINDVYKSALDLV